MCGWLTIQHKFSSVILVTHKQHVAQYHVQRWNAHVHGAEPSNFIPHASAVWPRGANKIKIFLARHHFQLIQARLSCLWSCLAARMALHELLMPPTWYDVSTNKSYNESHRRLMHRGETIEYMPEKKWRRISDNMVKRGSSNP